MVQTIKTQPSHSLRGFALLDDPIRNKGTAFTLEERRQYGLEGLLPHSVETLDRQVERVMEHLDAKASDLERYIYLIGLSDRNETLFYRAVMSDPARFIPILYDPTVADACLAFGHIYRRARGLYITREMKGRIAEVLRNWPEQELPLHLRFHGRAYPGPRRHRRQRHGHPDRQAAALHRLRGGAA